MYVYIYIYIYIYICMYTYNSNSNSLPVRAAPGRRGAARRASAAGRRPFDFSMNYNTMNIL